MDSANLTHVSGLDMAIAITEPIYEAGDIVPFRLSPGIFIASIFVSLIGAVTTVELLHRRTNGKGWHNWVQLGSCSLSMGLVAIWGMHYVGNQAIILGNGEAAVQLMYNSGFTALSSFIPVMALLAAFTVADLRYRGKRNLLSSLFVSGVIAGLATVGMHYVGNLGISNYYITFDLLSVGGAIGIACALCIGALTLIFLLQDLWLDKLQWRFIAAVMIAGAVSGMHFEASKNTSYKLAYRMENMSNSRNTNVIIATVLSLLTIPVCVGIGISTSKRRKQLIGRAQQVVLACARFDTDGKLMVTHEGLMPCQKITVQHNQRSFEDDFNVSHPAFQWIFRLSHNWLSIVRYKDDIRHHLNSVNFLNAGRRKSISPDSTLPWDTSLEDQDYSVIFRESFFIAAYDLAAELGIPVSEMGTLYDCIMMTGTLTATRTPNLAESIMERLRMTSSTHDIEANRSPDLFGKGQLLILADTASRKDVSKFVSKGYRFMAIEKINQHLAQNLQIPLSYLTTNLKRLKDHTAKNGIKPPSGVLLGCFALRAGFPKKNWEVLVQKNDPSWLPAISLSQNSLTTPQKHLLSHLHGMSVVECQAYLLQRTKDTSNLHTTFWNDLKSTLTTLSNTVAEPFFEQAIFSSTPFRIAIHDPTANTTSYCQLLICHVIPDVHAASITPTTDVAYSPLSFFRCRQQVLSATHYSSFERQVHCEFGELFGGEDGCVTGSQGVSNTKTRTSRTRRTNLPRSLILSKLSPVHWNPSHSMTHVAPRSPSLLHTLGGHNGSSIDTQLPRKPILSGGILVSSDVTVETAVEEEIDVTLMEMLKLGRSNLPLGARPAPHEVNTTGTRTHASRRGCGGANVCGRAV